MDDEVLICVRCPWMDAVFETVPTEAGERLAVYPEELRMIHRQDRVCPNCRRLSVFEVTPTTPKPGKWPCQTEVFGAAMARALPPRLVPFLYRLLRDGANNPGEVEQICVEVADHGREVGYTNSHLEQYALALAAFLIHQPGQG